MNNEAPCLSDGQYPCQATLHIKDGKAVVLLHSLFGLRPGSTIPLLRRDANLLIEASPSNKTNELGLLNGHGII